jgi:hypothetical protein
MFAVRPGAYPRGAFFSFSPLGKTPSITCKLTTRLERLGNDMRSCLLQTITNYVRKKFLKTRPRYVKEILLDHVRMHRIMKIRRACYDFSRVGFE